MYPPYTMERSIKVSVRELHREQLLIIKLTTWSSAQYLAIDHNLLERSERRLHW